MLPFRRNVRLAGAFLALASMCAATLIPIAPVAAAPEELAPRSYGAMVTFTGHGSGHGDGLSQYGALGYAINFGWDWTQILAHYYGGTTRDAVSPTQAVRVNLTGVADATASTVVASTASLTTNADGGVGRFSTVVALEVAPLTYRVYGRTDAPQCPATVTQAAFDLAASGWTLLHAGFVSTSLAVRLSVAAAGQDAAAAPVESLAGVCQPDGSVRQYRGSIEILNGTEGENRTVNAVPIDQYLRGVVPQEAIASWGDSGGGKGANALRAQAVAARTYVLTETRNTYAQTCDTPDCQMYVGAGRRASPTASSLTVEDPRTDAAVLATAGVVLRNAAGNFAFTQFNASSGGYTSGRNFPAVEDLGDDVAGNNLHTWTATIARSTIEAAYPTIGQLLSVDVPERNGLGEWGGRARKVRLRGSTGTIEVTGEAFRSSLRLKSTWFTVASGCAEGPRGAPLPRTAAGFHPLAPVRIVDTRVGLGATTLDAACVLTVHVAGSNGVPAKPTAVAVNLTSVGTSTAGYLTAYPCDQGVPNASSVNARVEAPIANLAIVPVDSRGDICVYTQPSTNLLIDLLGWFGTGGQSYTALPSNRVADTRDGRGFARRPVTADSTNRLDLAAANLPAGTVAVALNVTATRTTAAGFLSVYPCGGAVPSTSSVNTVVGRDVANLVLAGVATDGSVCIFSKEPTDVVVDLLGAFGSGKPFVGLTPARLTDTRSGQPAGPGSAVTVAVPGANQGDIVAVNLTATRAAAPGFAVAYPCGEAVPATSSLNFGIGRDVANQALVRVGSGGAICLTTTARTDLIVDLQGIFGS